MAEPALVARSPADFVEAARGLVVATMLAALAGMVDVTATCISKASLSCL